MRARVSVFVFALVSTASLSGGVHADTQRVGIAGAVNPSALGTPPGEASRQLVVGSDVAFRERVITTAEGQAQILFLDQSTLMIGPNSTVVIDEFVYDPNTDKGNIAATLTQGSFRYIGGKLSKQGNATLKTPVASIGIRGSDVTVNFDADKDVMDVITTHGTVNVQTLFGTLGLRSGFGVTVNAGRPPAQPISLTAQQIAAANRQFEGLPGRSAGAAKLPTDSDVAKSGVGDSVEAQRVAAIEPAAGGPAGGEVSFNASFNVPFTPGTNDSGPTVLASPSLPAPNTGSGSNNGSGGGGSSPGGPGNGGGSSGPRIEQILHGYVAGLAGPAESTPRSIITSNVPDDVVIRTIPDPGGLGRVFATFDFRRVDSEHSSSGHIEFGDAPGTAPATRSTFTDNAHFSASQKGVPAGTAGTFSLTTDTSNIPGSNSVCTCEFVKWGTWTAKVDASSVGQSISASGFWVVGKLPDVTDPSPQGSATFNGTAIGAVFKGGVQSTATGNFTNKYNFSQRTGEVTISNFDGKTFGGTVKAGSDWRSYSGNGLSGSGLAGSINGAFYGSSKNPGGQPRQPNETAGNFNVSGSSGYTASGIFVGKRVTGGPN